MSEENNQQRNQAQGMANAQGMYQSPNYSSYYPSYPMSYQQPYYSSYPFPAAPTQPQPSPSTSNNGMLPLEQSYVENILRLNRGKVATIYMTFDNNDRWNAKIFKGRLEAAGRDHIIISDLETERRYVLLTIYLDYISFDEQIEYDLPFGSQQQLTTTTPR